MSGFFRFLISRAFWLNLLFILLFIVILIKGVLLWLDAYTLHGESVEVPDLKGMHISKLSSVVNNNKIAIEITDSIYSTDVERGVVVDQNPAPGAEVKEGRVVFLTVNSLLPEMVEMPDLVGKSRRIALPLLEIAGLPLKELIYRPDETCTDCVLDQLYNGESIKPGAKIRKGEPVSLVLGRSSNERIETPSLNGLTYQAAMEILKSHSLNNGIVLTCDGCNTAADTAAAYVYRQNPESGSLVKLGAHVDVFLTTDSTAISTDPELPDFNEQPDEVYEN